MTFAAGCVAFWRAQLAVALAVLVVIGWWLRIPARNDRDWSPDVARPAKATIAGGRVTIENVRNFDYRTETDYTERWIRSPRPGTGVLSISYAEEFGCLLSLTQIPLGCLDSRDVPPSARSKAGRAAAIALYETLSRIDLPALDDIPGADQADPFADTKRVRWVRQQTLSYD